MTRYFFNDIDVVRYPIEVAERVWWVGHVQENDPFQCHVYLIEQGRQSVLIDPGSRLTFRHTLRKIEEIIPFSHIRYFICHHQDPDIAGAMPMIDEMNGREDAVIVTHWRAQALFRHYGIRLPYWLVEEHDWQLQLEDRLLRFVFTPYAHFPGAYCTFDTHSRVLFSSDLFGGFTEEFSLMATDESYLEALRSFHEHYMPSRDILCHAMAKIEALPVRIIAPQHGSIIPEPLVNAAINKLKGLDCGLYLLARDSTDIQRLLQLNQALHDIMENLIVHRDFPDIAKGLLAIVQRLIPARSLEFYARLEDGRILHLAPENRYRGRIAEVPSRVAGVIGSQRQHWLAVHQAPYQRITLSGPAGEGDPAILLPLFSPSQGVAHALALIHLDEDSDTGQDIGQVIGQAVVPLEVAVERETIYRTLDLERQRFYERAIRDPLTGLFTRLYMQDMVQRLFSIHDRDPNAVVTVAMLDIDHFKRINDTFGHNQGDEVLRRVGAVLIGSVREGDLPVRLGGEEFAVFVMGQSAEKIGYLAERIRRQVAGLAFSEPLADWRVTVSIGTAVRRQQESLTELLERADRALYQAKETGRDRVCAAS